MIKTNEIMKIPEVITREPSRLLILFDPGQEEIVKLAADVLGKTYFISRSLETVNGGLDETVIGLENGALAEPESLRRVDRTIITAHCIDVKDFRDEHLTSFCDYEYLYTQDGLVRKDLVRFLGFILGHVRPHHDLKEKGRSTMLSTTFPDIRAVLPDLDILSVGADSIELRVDLLKDATATGIFGLVPGLEYVGEQVMLLRQRTELPIVFTTRCTRENGQFPMDDPTLVYNYLRKALQWGCEYVDAELWIPNDLRRDLAMRKGHSKIISTWHDFSGSFNWASPEAHEMFRKGAVYGDVVKMIAFAQNMEANYELEIFRSAIHTSYPNHSFSGFNTGSVGQLSRTLNTCLTPITHPLLPTSAASDQLSTAQTNSIMHSVGLMPRLSLYAFGHTRSNGLVMLFDKCFKELGQPHQLLGVERSAQSKIEVVLLEPRFGGAHIDPPLVADSASRMLTLSEAASAIGQIDVITVRSTRSQRMLVAENVTWKGIRATLTRDFVPQAYTGKPALVLGNSEASASAAIYALTSLKASPIYSIGFSHKDTCQLQGLDDMERIHDLFVVLSALPVEKSMIASPILKRYCQGAQTANHRSGRVFLDLSSGLKDREDSVSLAAALGWTSYGAFDVNARIVAETFRLLVGQNVPGDFVRLAGRRDLW